MALRNRHRERQSDPAIVSSIAWEILDRFRADSQSV
jgi:hypothetical protein